MYWSVTNLSMSIFQLGTAKIWIKTNVPHKSCVRKQETERECVGVRVRENTNKSEKVREVSAQHVSRQKLWGHEDTNDTRLVKGHDRVDKMSAAARVLRGLLRFGRREVLGSSPGIVSPRPVFEAAVANHAVTRLLSRWDRGHLRRPRQDLFT